MRFGATPQRIFLDPSLDAPAFGSRNVAQNPKRLGFLRPDLIKVQVWN